MNGKEEEIEMKRNFSFLFVDNEPFKPVFLQINNEFQNNYDWEEITGWMILF